MGLIPCFLQLVSPACELLTCFHSIPCSQREMGALAVTASRLFVSSRGILARLPPPMTSGFTPGSCPHGQTLARSCFVPLSLPCCT